MGGEGWRLVRRFDDRKATVPLHVVAFDLTEGREVLLSEGPALDSVAASASIPGVFPPVQVGDRHLIDGGVVNHTPISHAVKLGAERIFVLPTQDPWATPPRVAKSALDAAIHGFALLVGSRLQADIALYSRKAELIVLPVPNLAGVQPTSFEHSTRLMSEALVASRALLARRGVGRRLRLAGRA